MAPGTGDEAAQELGIDPVEQKEGVGVAQALELAAQVADVLAGAQGVEAAAGLAVGGAGAGGLEGVGAIGAQQGGGANRRFTDGHETTSGASGTGPDAP
ncbi:MAG TPA: hypothetical protein VI455_20375 [Terriglobia bacterium]